LEVLRHDAAAAAVRQRTHGPTNTSAQSTPTSAAEDAASLQHSNGNMTSSYCNVLDPLINYGVLLLLLPAMFAVPVASYNTATAANS
jgi:hypothetical protein